MGSFYSDRHECISCTVCRHTPSYRTFTAGTIAHTFTISIICLNPGRPIKNGATSNKLHETRTVQAINYHRRLWTCIFFSQKQLLFDSCTHRWRQLPHSSIHNTRSTQIRRRWCLMLRWRPNHDVGCCRSRDVRLMERCPVRCSARRSLDRRVVDGKSKWHRLLQRTRPVRHRLARRSKRRGCRRHQKQLQLLDDTTTEMHIWNANMLQNLVQLRIQSLHYLSFESAYIFKQCSRKI